MPLKYLLDTDVFVTGKRDHYGFDFCSGFWKALVKGHALNRIYSIEPVKKELLVGKDDLTAWVKESPPSSFFKKTDDVAVLTVFADVSTWVSENAQFTEAAKAKFLSGADPWLVAYANANEFVIVSYEVSSAESKASIKLPDVATQFGVDCVLPSEMMRELPILLRLANKSFK